jgi:glutamate synthase domain-containing protein 1
MRDLKSLQNPYGDDRVQDNCSVFGAMDVSGEPFSGELIITAIENMHDRGNGLGGGFAAYGIYPQYEDDYAFHVMFNNETAKQETEDFLQQYFHVHHDEVVPTRPHPKICNPPVVYRYFLEPRERSSQEEDLVVEKVMHVNTCIPDAFVFSSGKNMGVFKGVGYPEDIGRYFRLEDYDAYIWTAHGRFPTNTQGWWGGAHPFSILDWTVVHNGEISSYGTNRRYLEMYGYYCAMETDSEVIAYAIDLLMRRQKMPVELACGVIAPPLWDEIDRMPQVERELHTVLRKTYGPLLMNGPFTVIAAHQGEMIGLTDRIRLRPLTAAVNDNMLYLSSEEASIRLVDDNVSRAWIPRGGEPIIGRLETQGILHNGEPVKTAVEGY